MDAIDRLKTAEHALDYWEDSKRGVVSQLNDIHRILKEVHERTDDSVIKLLVEGAMLKIEAQLNY